MSVLVDGVPICNNDINKRIFRFEDINGSLTPDIVTAATKYETAVPAFTRMIKGFAVFPECAANLLPASD